MRKKTVRWRFYTVKMSAHNGQITFSSTEVKSTARRWPVSVFENFAKKMGFTQLVKNETIIGGHFYNPETEEDLVCVPDGFNPLSLYR